MAGNGFWDVGYTFQHALQLALSSVTRAILLYDGPNSPDDRNGVLALSEPRVRLGRSSTDLSLSLAMRFRFEPDRFRNGEWLIETFAYSYLLFHGEREEVAYHWDHEAVASGAITTPHVHFGKDMAHSGLPVEDRLRLNVLSSAHWPTGPVLFTDILRTVIRDLGVEPLRRQGEPEEAARIVAEQRFQEADAALRASFAWWERS